MLTTQQTGCYRHLISAVSTDPDTLRQAIIDVGEAGFEGMGGSFVLNSERNVEREFVFTKWNGKSGDEVGFALLD